jgi:hypothetical protein
VVQDEPREPPGRDDGRDADEEVDGITERPEGKVRITVYKHIKIKPG